tara:strand:+ start:314 stop:496 length:183 start_codon:yes stop_codon:yes gene_type:complete
MDARQLKKEIMVFAMDKVVSSNLDEIAVLFDKDVDQITNAEIERFERVANKMLDDAISKL